MGKFDSVVRDGKVILTRKGAVPPQWTRTPDAAPAAAEPVETPAEETPVVEEAPAGDEPVVSPAEARKDRRAARTRADDE